MAPLLFVATGQGSHLITKGRQQGHGCETNGAVAHGLVLIQPDGQGQQPVSLEHVCLSMGEGVTFTRSHHRRSRPRLWH